MRYLLMVIFVFLGACSTVSDFKDKALTDETKIIEFSEKIRPENATLNKISVSEVNGTPMLGYHFSKGEKDCFNSYYKLDLIGDIAMASGAGGGSCSGVNCSYCVLGNEGCSCERAGDPWGEGGSYCNHSTGLSQIEIPKFRMIYKGARDIFVTK